MVLTTGDGPVTYTAPEEDWIVVKPGDRLAIYETYSPIGIGGVSYGHCDGGNGYKVVNCYTLHR